jgi:hypothetical protein
VTLARFGDRRVEERLAAAEEGCGTTPATTLRHLWARARAELGIPEVPPLPVREPEAAGVGGRTTS